MPSALVYQLALRRREIRLAKASRGRRQKRMPKVHPPKDVTLSYAHFIRGFLVEANAHVLELLLPVLRGLAPSRQDSSRLDARLPPRANAALQEAKDRLVSEMDPPRLAHAIQQVGGSVSRAQRKDILYQLSSNLGFNPVLAEPELGPQMAKFTAENVSLIRTLPGSYFSDIEETVAAGIDGGDTWQDIADDMTDRLGVAESRANLIARDQVGKFYGKVNQARQVKNGIESYFWRTSGDNRVRDNHTDLNGIEFDWDEPPEGGGTAEDEEGHPGSGINCRCGADPNVSALLASL